MRNGIDESLDLLKDLEAKLRIQQNHQVQSEIHHLRTEPKNQKNNSKQWGEKLITAYQQSDRNLQEENCKLKKYVNRLIKMNDYLKNQLVQGDNYKGYFKDSSQAGLLQLEVQYLREINREKELQIQLYHKKLQQNQRKASLIIPFNAQFETRRERSSSINNCIHNAKTCKLSTSRKPSEMQTIRKSSMKRKKNKCPLCYH